jgi:hypothetical protein
LSETDGHYAPWLFDDFVPCLAAYVDDVVVGLEDAVGQPVFAHELPEVFDWVEFWGFGRQRQKGYIIRDFELLGCVPSSLIEDQYGMTPRIDRGTDFLEVLCHGEAVAEGHYETGALALFGTDCAKDIGPLGPLIFWR